MSLFSFKNNSRFEFGTKLSPVTRIVDPTLGFSGIILKLDSGRIPDERVVEIGSSTFVGICGSGNALPLIIRFPS